jgi:hypothetical protein
LYLRSARVAHARGRQISGVAKYFSKINFKNDIPNEKKNKTIKKENSMFYLL